MRTVLVVGYHGMANFGDDLFFKIICTWLSASHGVERVLVTASNEYPVPSVVGVDVQPIYPNGRRISRLDFIRNIWASYQVDAVIFAAGSIFTGRYGSQLELFSALIQGMRMIKQRELPMYALGVSVGPFGSNKSEASFIKGLSRFSHLLTRDTQSSNILSKVSGIQVIDGYDLAALYFQGQTNFQASCDDRQKVLGVSIGPGFKNSHGGFDKIAVEGFANTLAITVANAITNGTQLSVRLLVACCHKLDGDLNEANFISDILNERGFNCVISKYSAGNPLDFIQDIAKCNAIISSRLHPSVIAMGFGIPVFQVGATSRKIRDVFDRLGISPSKITDARVMNELDVIDFVNSAFGKQYSDLSEENIFNLNSSGNSVQMQLDAFGVDISRAFERRNFT